ncbi:MAG: M23 family metallopeptidase [Methylocystaceae bacterium]|nr:M23 family metallopeptidase [Methylocystaceae bacterium]
MKFQSSLKSISALAVVVAISGCVTVPVNEDPIASLKEKADWKMPDGCYPVTSPFKSWYGPGGGKRHIPHKGMDITAPEHTAVLAAHGGQVLFAGEDGLDGHTVRTYAGKDITGNHIYASYVHMDSTLVKTGDYITRGQKVGGVSSTGAWGGRVNHLHMQVQANNHGEHRFGKGGYISERTAKLVNPQSYWYHKESSEYQVVKHDEGINFNDQPGVFRGFSYPVDCKK